MISTLCAFYMQAILTATETHWDRKYAPLVMAQMTQESACKKTARSPYAHGLMQFTKDTANDAAKGWCKQLGPLKLYNPEWQINCGVLTDLYLYDRMAEYSPDRERIAAVLASYNGGRGWVNRDNKVCQRTEHCDPSKWFYNVEFTPDTRRAFWAIKENRGYPRRILNKLLIRYEDGYSIQTFH